MIAKLPATNSIHMTTQIEHYLTIIERGQFLQEFEWEGLDPIKAKISDQIIDGMMQLSAKADNKLKLRIANIILIHDSLNEDGLRMAVNALKAYGRNGEANNLYTSFAKRYKNSREDPLRPAPRFVEFKR